MKSIMLALLVVSGLLGKCGVFGQSTTVFYQPTKYPKKKSNGSPMPEDVKISHIWDGWFNNSFNKNFVQDTKLQIGGWGDVYVSAIKFDLTGLPRTVDKAHLYLYAIPSDSANSSQMSMYRIAPPWTPSIIGWNSFPKLAEGYYWPVYTSINSWRVYNIVDWYKGWQNGSFPNNGILMYPYKKDSSQRFDRFASSRISSGNDASFFSRRPLLRLDFTPTLRLKMPLPGNHRWLVTTEVGGYDCFGVYDKYHDGQNYFSVDFSWRNLADTGATTYNSSSKIPILASAEGIVAVSSHSSGNGNYVVIDHDKDGNLDTGFQTFYLHMQSPGPLVVKDKIVKQGEVLGYMGNTGISMGVHLHFGVRYRNSGASTIPELTKVLMDGWLLKSFQTECEVDSGGKSVGSRSIRYYRSMNTVY